MDMLTARMPGADWDMASRSMKSSLATDICIINKIDLLPYVDSDVARLKDNALKINPQLCFFEISATRGMGMDEWCEYLLACFERKEEK